MKWPFVLIAVFCAGVHFVIARHKALWILEDGRDSHVGWLNYLHDDPDFENVRLVGDVAHQQRWIDNYDHVIRLLRLRDSRPEERHVEG